MANFDCYVRIYLPLNAAGMPDTNQFGMYDLQIEGINDADLPFDSHTTVNSPVFTFGGIGGNGYVRIFPDAKTSSIFSNQLICKYHFTASDTAVMNFLTTLKNTLTFVNKDSNSSLYRVTSGPQTVYNDHRYNTFGATAVWAGALGDNTLVNIYNTYTNDTTGYWNYAAWEMFNTFHTAWSFDYLLK